MLGQKGPIAPPPILEEPYQTTAQAIRGWKDVISATHWHLYNKGQVDGIDFYVKDRELGHIHLNGDIHLATNDFLGKLLVNHQLASTFPYSGYENWVLFQIHNPQSAQHAVWLFQMNYNRLRATSELSLNNDIKEYIQSKTTIEVNT